MYYIISLKHTQRADDYITLWRANNRGYCYAKENAGIYAQIIKGYHDNVNDSLPVKVEELDRLFIEFNNDIFEPTPKKYIPNCKTVWDHFNLKMTKRGLVIKSK